MSSAGICGVVARRIDLPITAETIAHLERRLGDIAQRDIKWQENVRPPSTSEDFALDVIFVVCNSGMTHTTALIIFDRVKRALLAGKRCRSAYRHPGKSKAIDKIWKDRSQYFSRYLYLSEGTANEEELLEFFEELPFIGPITRYHVAKNFGIDVAKPDVHLQRLSELDGRSVKELCRDLSFSTGYGQATIDIILWRACACGLLDSRTGLLRDEHDESHDGGGMPLKRSGRQKTCRQQQPA